jgi:hypothetical protein
MVLEDVHHYHTLTAALMDAAVSKNYRHNTGAITDGTYASHTQDELHRGDIASPFYYTKSAHLQGMEALLLTDSTVRFTFRLMHGGLLSTKKLIPLKWMASSLALELTLNNDKEALMAPIGTPTYEVSKPTILAELLNFDSQYDSAFYLGMSNFGVPLKFHTWRWHHANLTGNRQTIQIHERARSIKMLLAIVRDQTFDFRFDSLRFYHATGTKYDDDPENGLVNHTQDTPAKITQFQWRIGGRYMPAQPVDCAYGGAEAYIELLKAIDALSDYSHTNHILPREWHSDYGLEGGNKFIMAAEFENTDISPDTISGINGMEQSDIMFDITMDGAPYNKNVELHVAYDAMILLRPENSIELIL